MRGRPFQKGCKPGPGRKPKSAEQSELERWSRVVDSAARTEILEKIRDEAKEGKPWAIQIIVDRLWPAEFIAAKINEADGARDNSSDIADALRDVAEQLRPVAPDSGPSATPDAEPAS